MYFGKNVIDDYDSIDLLFYALDDECYYEVGQIKDLLRVTDDCVELAEGVYKVFVELFLNKKIKPYNYKIAFLRENGWWRRSFQPLRS